MCKTDKRESNAERTRRLESGTDSEFNSGTADVSHDDPVDEMGLPAPSSSGVSTIRAGRRRGSQVCIVVDMDLKRTRIFRRIQHEEKGRTTEDRCGVTCGICLLYDHFNGKLVEKLHHESFHE